MQFLEELALDELYALSIEPYQAKRSSQQNRRYWAVLREVADQLWVGGRLFEPDTWHEQFKRTFIGQSERVLPDGSIEVHGLSTAQLKVREFAEYMTQIEAFASKRGVQFTETRDFLNDWRRIANGD